jgi:hypothetical protein
LATQKLKFFLVKLTKEDNDAVYIYRVSSPDRNYDVLNNFLLHHQNVRSFEA